jgi:hypothetical protein
VRRAWARLSAVTQIFVWLRLASAVCDCAEPAPFGGEHWLLASPADWPDEQYVAAVLTNLIQPRWMMQSDTKQNRVSEGVRAIFAEAQSVTKQNNREWPYWGVLCRTCREVVAFDSSPYVSFGPAAASMKPGAIRCGQGHTHIYFPRDFQFCASAVPIPDGVMRENRDLFQAINSTGVRTSHDVVVETVEPARVAAVPQSVPEIRQVRPELSRDPRREAAQTAARARWANWAGLKAR